MYSNFFFFENRTAYETMWKNFVEPGKQLMTIWRMPIACWIPKATNTHSGYVILIDFPLQQWQHECASTLCLYVHCLSRFTNRYDKLQTLFFVREDFCSFILHNIT